MKSSSEAIGVGVIGCGKAGTAHLTWYSQNPFVKLVGVYDPDPAALEAAASRFRVTTFNSIEDLLEQSALEMVSICGPSNTRAEQVLLACRYHKQVVCEKPMATNLEECRAMIQAASEHRVKLMCFLNMRFHPVIERIDRLIAQIGPIYHIDLEYTQFRTNVSWRHKLVQGGGVLKEQGIHPIDLALHWVGDVENVEAETLVVHPDREVEDHCVTLCRFKSGALGVIYTSYSDRQEESMFGKILGLDGQIRFTLSPYNPDFNRVFLTTDATTEVPLEDFRGVVDPVYPGLLDATKATIDHFVDCVRLDQETPLDGPTAMKAMEVVMASYLSQATCAKVSLPVQEAVPVGSGRVFPHFHPE